MEVDGLVKKKSCAKRCASVALFRSTLMLGVGSSLSGLGASSPPSSPPSLSSPTVLNDSSYYGYDSKCTYYNGTKNQTFH